MSSSDRVAKLTWTEGLSQKDGRTTKTQTKSSYGEITRRIAISNFEEALRLACTEANRPKEMALT